MAGNSVNSPLDRIERAFRRLWREVQYLTDEEMVAFRMDRWPRHPHWCGEDGSIRGILWHVAAWKQALALALTIDPTAQPYGLGPAEDSAAGILKWLEESQRSMITALAPYFASPAPPWPALALLEGMSAQQTIDVWEDHDRYHTAQIVYLRQRWAAASE